MGIPFLIFLRKTSLKMKFLVIAALISLAASASVGRNQQWDDFKVKFNKGFRDLKHESERRAVFEANLDTIEAHNVKYEKGLSSYKMGINQFTDMTYEEFSNIVLMDPRDSEHVEVMQSKKIESSAPDAWDWRDEGILNPVKDQASCGNCWAFSTVGSTEAAWARAGNDLVSLSEQMFIDCGAGDCNGGWVDRAFDTLLAQGGDCLETDTHTPHVTDMAASLTNPRLLLPSVDTKKFLEISMLIPSTKMDLTPSICMLTPTSNTTAVESLTMNLAPNSPTIMPS